MATYTTTTRINDLINQSGNALMKAFDADAITNAAAYANDYIEEIGVPTTDITEGMKAAADQFALAYLAKGLILQMAVRGDNKPSIDAIRRFADTTQKEAERIALAYASITFNKPKIVQNENWGIWPKNERTT